MCTAAGDRISRQLTSRIDATGAHVSFLVCNAEGKAVGTVRLVALPTKVKLTRLAIEKDYRKYGLGRVLVRALEEFVANNSTREDFAPHVKEVDGKKVITVKIHSQVSTLGGRGAHCRFP